MAELTSNHKNLLRASIIGGMLFSGLFGWLGYEDFKERKSTLETIAQRRSELDRADAQIREIPKLEERIIVLRETVNEYVRILPDDKEITSFIDQLTQFAARSDVRVRKLDDEDVRARSGRNKKGATAAFDRVVYKLSLEGNCEQLLTFMDLFENHERFVKIGSFKVEHRDSARDGVDPFSVPHQIDLDLETYVYNPKVRSKENVVIPQETQKLERLKEAGLIGDTAQDIVVATYDRQAGSERRDIFYDPRILRGQQEHDTEEMRAAQRSQLEELRTRFERLQADLAEEAKIDNMVRLLQAREKNNKEVVAMNGEIVKAKPAFTVEEIRTRFEREVEQPFLLMAKDRQLVDMPVPSQQIEEYVAKMRAAVEDVRWDEVVTLYDELTRVSAAATGADVKAMLKEADAMHRVAKAHLDFNARPISFGGAVCFENDPAHAVVIINGRSYGPGESVDQDLVVRAISPASITFEFRGIVLTQPMKSSAPRPCTTEKQPRSGAHGPSGSGAQKRKKA